MRRVFLHYGEVAGCVCVRSQQGEGEEVANGVPASTVGEQEDG